MVKRIAIAVVVIAVVAGGGWWAWSTYGAGSSSASTTALGGTGTVEADEVAVSSLISGRIVTADAQEGAEVASGTALFKLDDSLLALQVSQAEDGVKAALANLDQVKADKGTTSEIAQAQARVDQARAALEMAKVQEGYATVAAPVDGTLTQVTASVGENAAPGKTLAVVSDLTKLHVSIYIAETDIGKITIGKKASVTTDSSAKTFSAKVSYIASDAEFTPSNIETKDQRVKLVYEVRLDLENPGGVLKPGMLVDVTFE